MNKIYLLSFLSLSIISCEKKVEQCTNGLNVHNNKDCKCPPGSLALADVQNGMPRDMCVDNYKWTKYIKGSKAANSALNDSVVFKLAYSHINSHPYNDKPFYFTNIRAYVQQINRHTRVAEYKIGNVECLVYLEDLDNNIERSIIIDLRGALNNTYESIWGDWGFATDTNFVPYGWNVETGEGIYLKGKVDYLSGEFYDWNIHFTPPGDSTTYEYTRTAPIEFVMPD